MTKVAKKKIGRRADCLRHVSDAMNACEAGDRERAWQCLLAACIAYRLGEGNELSGYRDKRGGRPEGAKAKCDKDQDAIDWALAESKQTGEIKPQTLAKAAIKACMPATFKGSQREWERAVQRLTRKIKRELAAIN